jgi:rod shape-determining protein MreD
MTPSLFARIVAIVTVAAVFQVAALSSLRIFGGMPDLLLVALVAVALVRGSVAGAIAGFVGGLVIDVSTLGTLGLVALLLTIAGYWAGRYGETTGRGRSYAPVFAVVAITVLFGVGAYALTFMLGEAVSARTALIPVLPATVLNAILAFPVYAVVRRLVGTGDQVERSREVQLLA